MTIELPEGYTLSEYRADIEVNGGVLIEPEAYLEKEEAYYLSLDRKQFTKEQAIEIAKTVRFVE